MSKLPPHVYYVYVIEAIDKNGRSVLYVGQSGKTPTQRLADHKSSCPRYCTSCACRHYVKGEVKGLRRDLYAHYNPISSRKAAEEIERWLARLLRKRGYHVIGGH